MGANQNVRGHLRVHFLLEVYEVHPERDAYIVHMRLFEDPFFLTVVATFELRLTTVSISISQISFLRQISLL